MTSPTNVKDALAVVARRIMLAGRVQGVGLRPAMARLAREHGLGGYVRNASSGVELHIQGSPAAVAAFESLFATRLPAAARLESWTAQDATADARRQFVIADSIESGPPSTPLPVDLKTCDDCLAETRDHADRRWGYPFTSCTQCGPRYSLIKAMPYDRAATGMAGFAICADCQREYEARHDRRFHSQTNACPACGPHVWCADVDGRVVAEREPAVALACDAIRAGKIVALRGLGGYQLLLDATQDAAVERLRARKRRERKPLAIMVGSLQQARSLAELNDREVDALQSPANPIVLVKARSGTLLARSIHPGLAELGLLLPTTPLHAELLDQTHVPLVCTSGNAEGEPLAFQVAEAQQKLPRIADLFLHHDRPIVRPIDDSVVRVMGGKTTTIRLARGLAPLSLPLSCATPLLALGGQQKSAIALCNGAQSLLGAHLGDLTTMAACQRFTTQQASLVQLHGAPPRLVVHDQHPDYFTTRFAAEQGVRSLAVQHHHAHLASAALEQGWLERPVLGVIFDGTGLGSNGTIWGGEFLLGHGTSFRRVAHLRPFRLPGSEAAVRQPWRISAVLLRDALDPRGATNWPLAVGAAELHTVLAIADHSRFSPITTSAGRLFDGVASLILSLADSSYEGEPAMRLEAACDPTSTGEYGFPLRRGDPIQVDWRHAVRQVCNDLQAGESPGVMAMRFHRGLARAVVAVCGCFSSLPVVLAGGVFQNRVLVELIAEEFRDTAQPLALPGGIPPGDGGLAAGQLALGALTRAAEERQRNGRH